VDFHLRYKDIVQLDKAWDGWTPYEWIGNVRWEDALSWARDFKVWKPDFDRHERSLRSIYKKYGRPGDMSVLLSRLSFRWGALPGSDEALISYRTTLDPDITHKAKAYGTAFRKLSEYPQLLTGLYVWPWGIYKDITGMGKKHPEWFKHKQDGNLAIAMSQFSRGATIEFVPMFIPEYNKWWVANGMAMVDYMKLRVFYTDGSLMTAPILDWNTMKVRTQADGLKLAKLLWSECRKRNVVYFSNDAHTPTPFRDVSWMESVATLLDPDNWRPGAESFLTARVYANPEVPQFTLYWMNQNQNQSPALVILLGLRTDSARFKCPMGVVQAYIQLGQEMFGYSPVFPDLRPCYWVENTNIEAYALKRKDADGVLLTFQNHNKQATDITLSFNAAKAGLNTAKPLYAVYSKMRKFDNFKTSPANGLLTYENLSKSITVKGQRLSITIKELAPYTPRQLFVTSNPVLVWTICGQPTLFKANYVINAEVKSITDTRFEIKCARPATLLVMTSGAKIKLNGKIVATATNEYGQLVEITPGKHIMELINLQERIK
jgi:hypothetical protein